MNYDVQSLGDESNAFTQAESEPTTTTAQFGAVNIVLANTR
jgi:hypothetical protein